MHCYDVEVATKLSNKTSNNNVKKNAGECCMRCLLMISTIIGDNRSKATTYPGFSQIRMAAVLALIKMVLKVISQKASFLSGGFIQVKQDRYFFSFI